jgi:hypothetical protein
MTAPNPIPSGSDLDARRQSKKPDAPPTLPALWSATVLLSPFGDSVSPLSNYSQLVVGTIECSYTSAESWMRVALLLTKDQRYFEFIFKTATDSEEAQHSTWYWIDSTPQGHVSSIYGPFQTTLQVPVPTFFSDKNAQWGNVYPLMCTDSNPTGIDCDHWILPSPGSTDHGSWYAFRKRTGNPFRVFMMDSTNPLMLPILGSYYIANLPTFTPNVVSNTTKSTIESIRGGAAKPVEYWNPMVTQQDIHRAMAFPLASAACTPKDIQAVLPGFTAIPSAAVLPRWSDRTYIEGWTIGTDFVPYFTRVCYLWTGKADSKQQTVFIGLGTNTGQSTYKVRSDTCLNMVGTVQPYYEWQDGTNSWVFKQCLPNNPPVGLPKPDWVSRDNGVIMGQIRGNQDFGLAADQAINVIAAQLPRGGGELAIFWLWFLEDGTGMLFTEGNYMNPLSHNLQLIDYNVFVQNADLTQNDFTNPCAPAGNLQAAASVDSAHGHSTFPG